MGILLETTEKNITSIWLCQTYNWNIRYNIHFPHPKTTVCQQMTHAHTVKVLAKYNNIKYLLHCFKMLTILLGTRHTRQCPNHPFTIMLETHHYACNYASPTSPISYHYANLQLYKARSRPSFYHYVCS